MLFNTVFLIQLALTSAPSNSEIFLFTNAPAKDKQLKSTVIALIERTQTVVSVNSLLVIKELRSCENVLTYFLNDFFLSCVNDDYLNTVYNAWRCALVAIVAIALYQ